MINDTASTSPSIYANFHTIRIYRTLAGLVPLKAQCSAFPLENYQVLKEILECNKGKCGILSQLSNSISKIFLVHLRALWYRSYNSHDKLWANLGLQEANWYKPEPGEPYRPLLAMPNKLRHAQPWLSFCGDAFFTAYDPPHALVTEAALLPPTSAGDPKPVSVPSPTQDTGARATISGDGSIPKPAIVPTMDQPKATPNPPPTKNGDPSPMSQSKNPAASDTSPSDSKATPESPNVGSDPKKGSDSNQGSDPKQETGPDHGRDPKQHSNFQQNTDPNQGSNSNKGSKFNPEDHPDQSSDSKPDSQNNSNPKESTNPSKSYLLPQTLMDVISSGEPNGSADAIIQNDPKQGDETDIAGEESGQNRQQVNDPKASTSPSPLDNPGSSTISLAVDNRKAITTNIAGQATTIGPQNAIEIAGSTLTPGAQLSPYPAK